MEGVELQGQNAGTKGVKDYCCIALPWVKLWGNYSEAVFVLRTEDCKMFTTLHYLFFLLKQCSLKKNQHVAWTSLLVYTPTSPAVSYCDNHSLAVIALNGGAWALHGVFLLLYHLRNFWLGLVYCWFSYSSFYFGDFFLHRSNHPHYWMPVIQLVDRYFFISYDRDQLYDTFKIYKLC